MNNLLKFRQCQLVISTPEGSLTDNLVKILRRSMQNASKPFIVSDGIDEYFSDRFEHQPVTPFAQVNQFLGQEIDCLIFDASKHFDVNAFISISGCLVGGGQLFLLLPATLESIAKGQQASRSFFENNSPCLIRLVERLGKISSSIHCCTGTQNQPSIKSVPPTSNIDCLLQQNNLVESIVRCSLGHSRRPIVITSDRGRGKSATLGIAAARLVVENNKRIVICSTRKQSLSSFYHHFDASIEQSDYSNTSNRFKDNLKFLPPDELANNKSDADLVIIDEAGAIPVQVLHTIANKHNRLVFATTIGGYEGNGKGFEVRFKPRLLELFPRAKFIRMTQPIRWALDDPLEQQINEAFLLDYPINDKTEKDRINPNNQSNSCQGLIIRSITGWELFSNSDLLKATFQILVSAHYQTRPSDLEQMLSNPKIIIYIASLNSRVVATALIIKEGNIHETQCQSIETGRERIKGHLLPQSMMAHLGEVQAGSMSFWRIMRIAVEPEFRRQNIASNVLQVVEEDALSQGINLIGCSYSLNIEVMQFWVQLEYQCFRLALSKDSSTGGYPGEFIKLIDRSNDSASALVNRLTSRFKNAYLYKLTGSYNGIDRQVLFYLYKIQVARFDQPQASSKQSDNTANITAYDKQEIQRYLDKARSFEMVEWSLYLAAKIKLNESSRSDLDSDEKFIEQQKFLIFAKLFQQHDWQKIKHDFAFSGSKSAKENLRLAFEALFANGR